MPPPSSDYLMHPDIPHTISQYITTYMPPMDGWCWPAKAEALALATLTHRPAVAVEIGVFAGRSAIAIALAMQHLSHGHIYGIDPWLADASAAGWHDENEKWWHGVDHDYIYRKCCEHIAANKVGERISLLRSTSNHIAAIISPHPFINLLHIDGNHSEEQSCQDVTAYVPLCTPGAPICFDDVHWATTKRAQRLLLTMCRLDRVIEGDGGQCAFYTRLVDTPTSTC